MIGLCLCLKDYERYLLIYKAFIDDVNDYHTCLGIYMVQIEPVGIDSLSMMFSYVLLSENEK